MHIEFFDKLGEPQRAPATRVIVFDANENPVALVVEYAGQLIHSKAGDDDFNQILRNLGVDKTVVCLDDAMTPIDQVRFDH